MTNWPLLPQKPFDKPAMRQLNPFCGDFREQRLVQKKSLEKVPQSEETLPRAADVLKNLYGMFDVAHDALCFPVCALCCTP